MESHEKTPRTHTEPFPRSLEELVLLFKRAVALPHVEEINVTPAGFRIRRMVDEGEAVLPKEGQETELLDPEFVLSSLASQGSLTELPFNPHAHPYHNVEEATRMVTARGVRPAFFFAPEGPWVAAYFDLPKDPPPTHVFGMKVIYSHSDTYAEKFVVVGSRTGYLSDSSFGVIIDMGV